MDQVLGPKEALKELLEVAGNVKLTKQEHAIVLKWGETVYSALVAAESFAHETKAEAAAV